MTDTRQSLHALEQHDDFVHRHIGPNGDEIEAMLESLDVGSLDELIQKIVPDSIRDTSALDLPASRREDEVLDGLRDMASANRVMRSMIGCGYYDTVTPPVILRNVLENPGWYTAYTPYQPEISQGRLEALLNFQTMVADLTGMAIANASLLDEASAAAEAMTMCHRLSKNKSDRFIVAANCHPQTIQVLQTRAEPLGIELVIGDPASKLEASEAFGLLLQYPATDGALTDYGDLVAKAHDKGALVSVATDLLSLLLLQPPGEWGADLVFGSAQRFGVPMGGGGPHAAFLATTDKLKRSLPGRLVGVSVDVRGNPALRLSLQTREQHIRREKATSNICTAQVLLAVIAGLYAVYHGPQRLIQIAERVHRLAATLAGGLGELGFALSHDGYFDTLSVKADNTDAVIAKAAEAGINLRRIDADRIGISTDEKTTRADIESLWRVFSGKAESGLDFDQIEENTARAIPDGFRRSAAPLRHPIFHQYHSETEMLRYLRRLQAKDIALDRSMIPLGSCTMKLNATAEMIPVTWPEFGAIHPYAPADQTEGYRALTDDLADRLCRITGFHAFSLQPNAGSQGEYAGLLAIRAFHKAEGHAERDICLIPSSAHGTNPASAVLAGMKVVVVACDEAGNVDLSDLAEKAEAHKDDLAALMVTYPSTHGVFEAGITEICKIIHDHGGQVYMDGANLNALVGVARPGKFGPDVAHVNLHKTFCIPHGGGGPGVGPIGVAKHLAPYLPGDPLEAESQAVTAAPWGSAGILPISWTYIALMGHDGLKKATEVAILNANYVAKRLAPHYPVLYTGPDGFVAHECIIDVRHLKESAGIAVDDIAKRLMDYGFHAPTMSFPVPGTLMIEPTESESKAELDRFCEAMIAIRGEIAEVEDGTLSAEDNPLINAPHSMADIVDWDRTYPIDRAVFPTSWVAADKYWPAVNRIDQVYGDRNLVCSCLPLDAYQETTE
ncbi:MAG: glycine dehydrogenase (aminomethyl-transferring) [Rhodospirillaceae bacterium]|nr:glycine dehydrogenase (aminomethyl-transferring) [Rhodospirillaceae bacterium]HAA93516.1 glycine dehydrogenase (aminomethyl-transferring) [Rhodospirillaceae bacterium]